VRGRFPSPFRKREDPSCVLFFLIDGSSREKKERKSEGGTPTYSSVLTIAEEGGKGGGEERSHIRELDLRRPKCIKRKMKNGGVDDPYFVTNFISVLLGRRGKRKTLPNLDASEREGILGTRITLGP